MSAFERAGVAYLARALHTFLQRQVVLVVENIPIFLAKQRFKDTAQSIAFQSVVQGPFEKTILVWTSTGDIATHLFLRGLFPFSRLLDSVFE